VPRQVSKRRNARHLASPLGLGKRCSALAFCARSRIGKVREIGRSVSMIEHVGEVAERR
jgi:hypothetical protein